MTGLLEDTIARIRPQDAGWRRKARARLEQLTMPYWALGRVMDLAEDLAGMTRSLQPPVARKIIVLMAGDHGVVAEGVSKYPQVVTGQMVRNFAAGGAGINALARVAGARVVVVDMGIAADVSDLVAKKAIISRRIAPSTQNMARGPAMSRTEAVRAIETGIELAQELSDSTDVFGTGDMGIGNTTASAAIAAVLTGTAARDVAGRGTGIDDSQFARKVDVIERSIAVNRPDKTDAIGVLCGVGGFEIGGLAGLILGAASLRKPVVLDGFIATAAALIAHALSPHASGYMIAGHRSAEGGHDIMLRHLNKRPLLDLDMRLGEGTGAALSFPILDAAVRVLTEVRTFEEASVSRADK
jgi:nicotinate-nucleotide--dimethylbenzimidazole phosphoribosyltransferase